MNEMLKKLTGNAIRNGLTAFSGIMGYTQTSDEMNVVVAFASAAVAFIAGEVGKTIWNKIFKKK